MLLIGSSDSFLRCQINTANLDGETNLKLRYCPSGLLHFNSVESLRYLNLIIDCEPPNANLYEFTGSLLLPANKLNEMSPIDSATKLPKEVSISDDFRTKSDWNYSCIS